METNELLKKVSETKKIARRKKSEGVTNPLVEFHAQLPLWEEQVRGIPNPIARSALFRVGSKKEARTYYKRALVASLNNIKIEVTGEELRVEDEDVWLALLHVARFEPLGECVDFTGYGILKELGWGYSKPCYERLRNCIDRLSATNVTISTLDDSEGYAGSLIRKFAWTDTKGAPLKKWKVWLEPELIKLFGDVNYTLVDWRMRMSIRKPMTKKLFTFYYTHRDPIGYKVASIKRIIGSSAARLSTFRTQLRESLQELVEIGMATGWSIDKNDIVHLERAPVKRGIVMS